MRFSLALALAAGLVGRFSFAMIEPVAKNRGTRMAGSGPQSAAPSSPQWPDCPLKAGVSASLESIWKVVSDEVSIEPGMKKFELEGRLKENPEAYCFLIFDRDIAIEAGEAPVE